MELLVPIPSLVGDLSECQAVLWVDFDNDGDKDLYLTFNLTHNKLYRNDKKIFTDITSSSGLSTSPKETYGVAWADINRDGYLDLYEVNQPNIGNGHNVFYLNNGNGSFTDITALAGVGNGVEYSFMPTFFDFDNNGWQDIFVTNDRLAMPALYVNQQDSTFSNNTVAANMDSVLNGMGIAVGDYNNDGHLDIYLTNTMEGNLFYKNLGNGTFVDVADSMNVLFNEETWGCVFMDYDQDKDLDLYVSGAWNAGAYNSSTMYRNDDSVFSEPYIGFIGDTTKSYSNAIGDYNNDGFYDIAVANQFPYPLQLWKCDSINQNHWIKIGLQGLVSNRDAIGTRIEVYSGGLRQIKENDLRNKLPWTAQFERNFWVGSGYHSRFFSVEVAERLR